MPRLRLLYILAAVLFFILGFYYFNKTFLSRSRPELKWTGFAHVIVDRNGPYNPWGKGVGDVNGDGLVDLIVGGHDHRPLYIYEKILEKLGIVTYRPIGGALVWYESPMWKKHIIATGRHFSTDIKVYDLDGDGKNDVICVTNKELL